MVRTGSEWLSHMLKDCGHYKTILKNLSQKIRYCYLHNNYGHNYTECNSLKEKCKHCGKALTEGDCAHELPRIRTTLKKQRNEANQLKSLDNSFISTNSRDYYDNSRNKSYEPPPNRGRGRGRGGSLNIPAKEHFTRSKAKLNEDNKKKPSNNDELDLNMS